MNKIERLLKGQLGLNDDVIAVKNQSEVIYVDTLLQKIGYTIFENVTSRTKFIEKGGPIKNCYLKFDYLSGLWLLPLRQSWSIRL